MHVVATRTIRLDKPTPVYDLTSPKHHNFVLSNGAVVHNSAKQARDAQYQEVLPLKGKPPNILTGNPDKIIMNDEVVAILRSIGYDPSNKEGPLAKMRVGKVIILTDSDVDGSHITNLLLAIFWTIAPGLIRDGLVYIVSDALFMAKSATKTVFARTRQEAIEKSGAKNPTITRVKGWGESLEKSTLVNTSNGIFKLGDLQRGHIDTTKGPRKAKAIHEYGKRKTRRLITYNGYKLDGHKKHRVLTMNSNGHLEWKMIGDVRAGDYVAIKRGCDTWATKPVTHTFTPKTGSTVSNGSWGRKPKPGHEPITVEVTPELARLMGYWIGDGGGHSIACGIDKDAQDDLCAMIEAAFPGEYYARHEHKHIQTCYNVRLNALSYEILMALGCKGNAYTKEIPWSILQSPRHIVAEFMKGLFEADGYIENVTCEYYTASTKLHDQVKHVLMNFGIATDSIQSKRRFNPFTKQTNNIPANALYFRSNNIDTFMREIGVVSKRKTDKYKPPPTRNTNVEIIPFIAQRLREIKLSKVKIEGGYAYVNDHGELVEASLGRQSIAKDYTYYNAEKSLNLDDISRVDSRLGEAISFCLEHKPFWSRVVSNRALPGRHKHYDLTMPATKDEWTGSSYIAGNFMVHNCNPVDLEPIVFAPSTREHIQILPEKAEKLLKAMGDDADYRRTLLGV